MIAEDPFVTAFIRAVEKINCRRTLELKRDRIPHFKARLAELGMTAKQAVIVIINVNDFHGRPLAEILMPGHNWQEILDRGEIPFAQGLAERAGIQEALDLFDEEAATKLRDMRDLAVVVIDHGVAEVFMA